MQGKHGAEWGEGTDEFEEKIGEQESEKKRKKEESGPGYDIVLLPREKRLVPAAWAFRWGRRY